MTQPCGNACSTDDIIGMDGTGAPGKEMLLMLEGHIFVEAHEVD